MTFTQLRANHPRFFYKSYAISQTDDAVIISHEFLLEPDIVFHPQVRIPYSGKLDKERLAPFAFHLGLIEAISYWKAACPSEVIVEAGALNQEQRRFWQDLFLHGLGEFYYQNQIDFTQPNFLAISPQKINTEPADAPNPTLYQGDTTALPSAADVVLMGGGKDSAVTLALLQASTIPFQTMVVNPTEASLANIQAAGAAPPIIVTRTIDPVLLELNRKGYLNGHTPFSAYLAFLGTTVAMLYGNAHVVVSNERSADEGNVVYHGMEINHQYSKSFRFESLFRTYCATYLTPDVGYFSFLRPLNDVQISHLFAKHSEFFTTFRSCNVGSKTNTWCGTCAKCAFTYLLLYPVLSHEQMVISFGRDLFAVPEILSFIKELVGLSPVKPFECVGTRDEAKVSLLLSIEKCKKEHREVPEGLLLIKSDLDLSETDSHHLQEGVIAHWSDTYNLPEEYITLLRQAWSGVSL